MTPNEEKDLRALLNTQDKESLVDEIVFLNKENYSLANKLNKASDALMDIATVATDAGEEAAEDA